MYDKDCIAEIIELIDDPTKVEDYNISYTWREKTEVKAGFWIRYTEPVKKMDKELHKMLEGNSFDYAKNWLKVELEPLKEHYKKQNIVPIPVAPITPSF